MDYLDNYLNKEVRDAVGFPEEYYILKEDKSILLLAKNSISNLSKWCLKYSQLKESFENRIFDILLLIEEFVDLSKVKFTYNQDSILIEYDILPLRVIQDIEYNKGLYQDILKDYNKIKTQILHNRAVDYEKLIKIINPIRLTNQQQRLLRIPKNQRTIKDIQEIEKIQQLYKNCYNLNNSIIDPNIFSFEIEGNVLCLNLLDLIKSRNYNKEIRVVNIDIDGVNYPLSNEISEAIFDKLGDVPEGILYPEIQILINDLKNIKLRIQELHNYNKK